VKSINIDWRQYTETGSRDTLYAEVLGYYLMLEPERPRPGVRSAGFTVEYATAGNPNKAMLIEPTGEFPFEMPSPSKEAAKQAAAVWLAGKICEAQRWTPE
jgi:hypothetical protein